MTESIANLIASKLAAAGFTAAAAYSDIEGNPEYCAFYKITELDVGELRHSSTDDCCITATAEIKMLGKTCGFSDEADLAEKAELFVSNLIFTSSVAVKKLTLGQIKRNMPLRRLERVCTAVLKTDIAKGG